MTRGLVRNALIVVAIALAARWATDVVLQPHLGTYVIDDYDVIGQNVLDGHGFSYQSGKTIPTVTRAPFYPLWWAAELTVFARRFLLLRMGEGLVDAVTAGLVVFMTAALCSLPLRRGPPQSQDAPPTDSSRPLLLPTLAGAIYAIQPFSIFYAAKMGTETWFALWLVLLIWAFAVWLLAPSYRGGAVLGAVAGVLLLNKSTAIGLLIVLAVVGVIWLRGRRTLACLSLALCFFVAGFMITPWMVRDYRVSGGHFVAIQTLTWWNFWADFDFSPSGYTNTQGGIGFKEVGYKDTKDLLQSHFAPGGGFPYVLSAAADVRQEARLQHQALQWMSAHPLAMLSKMGRNLLEFWYLAEGVRRAQIAAAAMALELVLATTGGWLAWRERRRLLVLLAAGVILYFDVVYTPIKSVFHYSLVVVPFLCVLQAFLLALVYGRVTRRGAS